MFLGCSANPLEALIWANHADHDGASSTPPACGGRHRPTRPRGPASGLRRGGARLVRRKARALASSALAAHRAQGGTPRRGGGLDSGEGVAAEWRSWTSQVSQPSHLMGQSRLVISTIMPAMLVDYQWATLQSFCSSSNYFPILYCYFRQQISSIACFPEGVIKSFPRCQGADHRRSTGSDSEAPGLHLITIQHAVWFGRQLNA